jgi:hypothetical protein
MSPRGVYNYIRTGLATVACSQEAFDAGPAHKAGQRGDRPGPLGRRGPGPTSSSPAHQETILIPLKKLLIFSTFLLCSRVVDSPPPGSLRILQSEQRRASNPAHAFPISRLLNRSNYPSMKKRCYFYLVPQSLPLFPSSRTEPHQG